MFEFNTSYEPPLRTPISTRGSEPSAEVQELRADVERLYFITEALWRILQEKHALDENEIIRQITIIDLQDGKLDGRKAKTPPAPCPKCNRTLGRQRMKCIYCGELIASSPFER